MLLRNSLSRAAVLTVVLAVSAPGAAAEAPIDAECRAIAAGVVAGMRAAGELAGVDATEAVVIAARRACMAARDDVAATPLAETAAAQENAEPESLWDIITRERERNPGHDRLQRLKR